MNSEWIYPSGQKMSLINGDLLAQNLDAIVNAANSHLQHGGGIAGLIVRRGGEQIQIESDRWIKERGPVSHDKPAFTSAGRLPYKYIIHAVGPIWGSGNEDFKLAQAIYGSLSLADELHINSLGFPAISTGIFGFPMERAAGIFFKTIQKYFLDFPVSCITQISIVLYDHSAFQIFNKEFIKWRLMNEAEG